MKSGPSTKPGMVSPSVSRVAKTPLVLMLALVGCSKPEPHSRLEVLAEVGGDTITEEQFRRWWSKSPPHADSPEVRHALLDKLIQRTQSLQRARALGLDRDPDFIETVESLLAARLHEARLKPDLAAARLEESELRAYYVTVGESQFRIGRRSRVAVLWLDPRGVGPLAARCQSRLEQARLELESDNSSQAANESGFGPLSIKYSEHRPSRFKGGDIGWVDLDSRSADP